MRRELRVNSQCSQQPSSVRELCPRFDAALLLAFEPSGGPGHLVRLPVSRQVGEGDKLYGSVTHRDIEEALGQAGYVVDRRRILSEPLKSLGTHDVQIRLAPTVTATIKVEVVAKV